MAGSSWTPAEIIAVGGVICASAEIGPRPAAISTGARENPGHLAKFQGDHPGFHPFQADRASYSHLGIVHLILHLPSSVIIVPIRIGMIAPSIPIPPSRGNDNAPGKDCSCQQRKRQQLPYVFHDLPLLRRVAQIILSDTAAIPLYGQTHPAPWLTRTTLWSSWKHSFVAADT